MSLVTIKRQDFDKLISKSPVKSERKKSPVKSERKKSPVKSERKKSPVKSERKKSPVKSERKKSPVKSERKEESLEKQKERKKYTVVNVFEGKRDLTDIIYMTFFAAFLFLGGTTLITFLAAFSQDLDTDGEYLRNAFVSETAVNVIASFTYMYFLKYIYDNSLPLENVTSVRYLDWFFTTPLLLISFSLYCKYKQKEKIDFIPLIYIIALNTGMLVFGFLGETGRMNKYYALIAGFGCFAGLMYFLYEKYIKNEDGKIVENLEITFSVFAAIWFLYGIAYLLPVRPKNVAYNVLDLISKGGFGVFLWLTFISETDNGFGF